MKHHAIAALCVGAFALSACQTTTGNSQTDSALVGGALGAVTAAALGGDRGWIVIGTIAGAAAGALIARNNETGDCAYADGNGGTYRAACP